MSRPAFTWVLARDMISCPHECEVKALLTEPTSGSWGWRAGGDGVGEGILGSWEGLQDGPGQGVEE